MAQRSRGGTREAYEYMTPWPCVITSKKCPSGSVRSRSLVERRRRREPALDDDPLAVAEFAVAGRAEDPVPLLPALEDAAVDGERRSFVASRPFCLDRSGTIDGRRARRIPRRSSSEEQFPATSGRDEVPSSKKSLRLQRLVPRLVVHFAAAAGKRQRSSARQTSRHAVGA